MFPNVDDDDDDVCVPVFFFSTTKQAVRAVPIPAGSLLVFEQADGREASVPLVCFLFALRGYAPFDCSSRRERVHSRTKARGPFEQRG